MKYNEFCKDLRRRGCLLLREGGCHAIWINPANGRTAAVPRHGSREVPKGTLKSVMKKLGL